MPIAKPLLLFNLNQVRTVGTKTPSMFRRRNNAPQQEQQQPSDPDAVEDKEQRTPIRDLCVYGLRHSPILRKCIPRVRRLAVIETLQFIQIDTDSSNSNGGAGTRSSSNGGDVGGDDYEEDEEAPLSQNETSSSSDRDQRIDEIALSIVLENVHSSPYLSTEDFVAAVKEVLTYVMQHNYFLSSETIQAMHQKVESQDWTGLLAVTSASGYGGRDTTSTVLYDLGAEIPLLVRPVRRQNYASIHSKHPIKLTNSQRLRLFRDMAVSIMSSSKRISAMRRSVRVKLSRKIHSASTEDGITKVALEFLERSDLITDEIRNNIKTAIDGKRFDTLLLPRCFDCDEVPRVCNENEEEDDMIGMETCTICFEALLEDEEVTTLSCSHRFRTECIREWAVQNPICPTCRRPIQNTNLTRNYQGRIELNEAPVVMLERPQTRLRRPTRSALETPFCQVLICLILSSVLILSIFILSFRKHI